MKENVFSALFFVLLSAFHQKLLSCCEQKLLFTFEKLILQITMTAVMDY